jgi:hypothetical protein
MEGTKVDDKRFDRFATVVGRGGNRRGVLRRLVGGALVISGLLRWAPGEEAVARTGDPGGELGGRHGPNRRGGEQHRSHGGKKDRNKKKAKNGGGLGSGSGFRDCSQVPKVPGADLSGCNLPDAQLSSADLTGANLFQANLARANLFYSTLSRVNFSGAILAYADLVDTDLSFADLSGANLKYANLTQAKLDGANLTGARFCHTKLPSGGSRTETAPRACYALGRLGGWKQHPPSASRTRPM